MPVSLTEKIHQPLPLFVVYFYLHSFFSLAFLMSFFHLSNSLQVNRYVGPLQLSLLKMCRDVGKFLVLFGMVFVSFSVAVRKVYSQFEQIMDLNPSNTNVQRSMHEFSG